MRDRPPPCLTEGSRPRPLWSSSNSQALLLLLRRLSFEASLVNGLPELLRVYLAIVVNHGGEALLHADIGSLHSLCLLQASFHANGAAPAGNTRNLVLSGGDFRHRRCGEHRLYSKQT